MAILKIIVKILRFKSSTLLIIMILCCTAALIRYEQSYYSHRTLCEWYNEDIYFIAPKHEYTLMKYDTKNQSESMINQLNPDSVVMLFTEDAVDSVLYFAMLPTPIEDYWLCCSGSRDSFEEDCAWWFRTRAKSYIYSFEFVNKQWHYITSIPGECQRMFLSPNRKYLILTSLPPDTIALPDSLTAKLLPHKSKFTVGFTYNNAHTFQFDIQNRTLDTIRNNMGAKTWALGYLPDSSLLILVFPSSESESMGLYSLKNNMYLQPIKTTLQLTKIEWYTMYVLPMSSILTYYNSKENKIYLHDISTGWTTALKALSHSYCVSPNREKIAFFIYDWYKKDAKLAIQIYPIPY